MTDPDDPLLQHYQDIAALSATMLEMARTSRWEELLACGARYQAAVENLKTLPQLDERTRERRRELLARILDDDARIRQLIAPELERLGQVLGTIRRQREVLQAYYHTVRAG